MRLPCFRDRVGCAAIGAGPVLLSRVHEFGFVYGKFDQPRLSLMSAETIVFEGTTVPIAPVPPSSGPQRIGKRNISLSPAQVGNFKQRLRKARPPGGYKSETAIATTHNIIKDGLPDAVSFFLPRAFYPSFYNIVRCGYRISSSPPDHTSTENFISKMS